MEGSALGGGILMPREVPGRRPDIPNGTNGG